MTTADTAGRVKTPKTGGHFRFPDPPEREPDDMTSAEHLSETGLHHHLKQFLGNPETTIVSGEKYIAARRGTDRRFPDLLVAFGVDPAAYRETNGYVISQQGKPPDLVLEIASEATGDVDVGEKREFYEGLGIPEYWRFDATGEHHKTRLAGDQLVGGRYEPIAIEELADGVLQGHSAILNLNWRWEQGQLRLHDPATGRHIATFEDERDRADAEREARIEEMEARAIAEAERNAEREARRRAEERAENEREARMTEQRRAEARIQELEEENQRLRGG